MAARPAPQAGSTSTRWSSAKRSQARTAAWSLTCHEHTGRRRVHASASAATVAAPSVVARVVIFGRVTRASAAIAAASEAAPVVSTASTGTSPQPTRCIPSSTPHSSPPPPTAGYYGSGYWFANTSPVSDAAEFSFYLSGAATRTVDAWWTSGTNRSATAPFIAFNAQGTKLGTVNVNQQANGGKWVQLGTYNFTAGWNKVVLSRWTTEGKVVIADAVRIR